MKGSSCKSRAVKGISAAIIVILSIAVMTGAVQGQTDYYVDQEFGDDLNDGLSWGTAKATIQAGIDAGSAGCTVHAAQGYYYEQVSLAWDGMSVLGGYPSGGGERAPSIYTTVIDGSASGTSVTIDALTGAGIDGFTIRNGAAASGAGLTCNLSESVTISDCLITQNAATTSGGGACCVSSSVVFSGCVIQGNTCSGSSGGAGIKIDDSEVEITDCLIDNNESTASSAYGGALNIDGTSIVEISGSAVSGNMAYSTGSHGSVAYGGAVYSAGELILTENVFTGNLAYSYHSGGYGGSKQKYAYGGCVFADDGCVLTLSNNSFTENTAKADSRNTSSDRRGYAYGYGGALYCSGGSVVELTGDLFERNLAYGYGRDTAYHGRGYGNGYGGAVAVSTGADVTIGFEVKIYDNLAQAYGVGDGSYDYAYTGGGGLAIWGTGTVTELDGLEIKGNSAISSPNTGTYGAGLYINDSTINAYNCIVAENYGDGIFLQDTSSQMINNTIAYNENRGIYRTGGAPTVRNCILWGNGDDLYECTATYSNVQNGDEGEGNLNPPCDPLFKGMGDYHIHSNSCCVDRGSFDGIPDHDVDGQARPWNYGIPDIGADETESENPTPTVYATPGGSVTPVPTPANDYYVDGQTGNDENDGLSWGTGMATIRVAVEAASAAGGGNIHVATWTYEENIVPLDNVRLYGGYAHGGGVRDPEVYLTTIDGMARNPCVRISGVSNVTVDGFVIRNGRGDYGGGIHISRGNNVTISDNRITANTAEGSPSLPNLALGGGIYAEGMDIFINGNEIEYNTVTGSSSYGGGIYCGSGRNMYVSGNSINHNSSDYAGGGVAVGATDYEITLHDNTIAWNLTYSTVARGGGVFIAAAGSAYMVQNSVTSNTAQSINSANKTVRGGGIYCEGSLTSNENVISENVCYSYYSGGYGAYLYEYAYGGGLYAVDGCTVNSVDDVFQSNLAKGDARNGSSDERGYGYGYGGGLFCEGGSAVTVTAGTISGNTAYAYGQDTAYHGRGYAYAYGGGVYCCDLSSVFINGKTAIEENICQCSSAGNSSRGSYARGGGIYISGAGAEIDLDGIIVRGNSISASPASQLYGYGIYINAAQVHLYNSITAEHPGTGIYLNECDPIIINDTIVYNDGYGIQGVGGSAPIIRNCILWANTDDLEAVSATYSNIQGGDSGEGNLNPPCDPLFLGGGDYHISGYSCCVDRGSYDGIRDHDLDGDSRPYNAGIPDIGADEVQGVNATPTAYVTPAGTATPGPSPTPAMDFYVDGVYGNDANDGLTWETAKASISAAIELASTYGGGNVHVASDVYYENLIGSDDLSLLGGYPAGGGSRDPDAYLTVIDGGLQDVVITIAGMTNVEIDGFMITNGEGEYSGGIHVSRSSDVKISGNIITTNACYGDPGSKNLALGAGIYLEGVNLDVANNEISFNVAYGGGAYGGGVYCSSGYDLSITGNTISYNTSGYAGGGLGIACSESAASIKGNLIENNRSIGSASRGGALYIAPEGRAFLENNEIKSNQARIEGYSGKTVMGGAIFCEGELTLVGNEITDNWAYNYYSGGYGAYLYEYAFGGGIYFSEGCAAESEGNIFDGNTAYSRAANGSSDQRAYAYGHGGCIYCAAGSAVVMMGDTIKNSTAYGYGSDTAYHGRGYGYAYGGGIKCDDEAVATFGGGMIIENCLAQAAGAGNSGEASYARGGGIHIYGPAGDVELNGVLVRNNNLSASPNNVSAGYGIYVQESPAKVYNSFVVEHPSTGIYLYGGAPEIINDTIAYNDGYGIQGTEGAAPIIRNCILWGNYDDLEAVTASYSNVQAGDAGEGNLDPPCNPLFIGEGDYHIRPNSCCIDRGLNTLAPDIDFDGEARPYNDLVVDIGADETQSVNPTPGPSITPATPTPVGTYSPTPADHYYVDKVNGDDSNDGLTWTTAKKSISAALVSASGNTAVHVAKAVYHENFELYDDVTLMGGYPVGGGGRNFDANVTIIDGGHRNSVIMINGASNITIDGFTIKHGEQNAGAGIYCEFGEHIAVKNCVFDSNTTGSTGEYPRGAGVYFGNCFDVWVINSLFLDNTVVGSSTGYGAGMHLESSAVVTVEDSIFHGNSSSYAAGAISCFNLDETTVISGCTFDSNLATNAWTGGAAAGGAIFCNQHASPQIIDNMFTENWAYTTGRGSSGAGGALYLQGQSYVTGNIFEANQARVYCSQSYNGYVQAYGYGGAVFTDTTSGPTITYNHFTENWSYARGQNGSSDDRGYGYSYGGALYCGSQEGTTTISHCTIENNTAYSYGRDTAYHGRGYGRSYGGAIYINDQTNTTIHENTLIQSNTATANAAGNSSQDARAYGGGIFIDDDVSSLTLDRLRIDGNNATASPNTWSGGDAIYSSSDDTIIITNNFITNNSGQGIYWATGGLEVQFVNNTLANNGSYGIYKDSGTLEILNCILWNNGDDLSGVTATYSNIEDGDAGEGNISADPEFVGQGDFHLMETSPCIGTALNAAEPDTLLEDYDGNSRPQDTDYDMGADEFAGAPMINLTLYLDGYYGSGVQETTDIDLELRYGSTPDTATTVLASYEEVALDEYGGTGDIELPGCPGGDLYLAVSHMNHLSVITDTPLTVAYSSTTIINLSEPDDPNFVSCYGIEPLGEEPDDTISARGGNANGDAYVNASGDFVIWLAANGSVPGSGNWDERADFNADEAVNSADYSEWLNQNGRISYVPDAARSGNQPRNDDPAARFGYRMVKVGEDNESYAEVEVFLTGKAREILEAIDAALAYNSVYLDKPVITADFLNSGMTDFSLGVEAPELADTFHYCRGKMPGQTGVELKEGRNALYRLRFPIKATLHSDSVPSMDSLIWFREGFVGAAFESSDEEESVVDVETTVSLKGDIFETKSGSIESAN